MEKENCATCEARTHDLQIMRLTRCRLRQGGTCYRYCSFRYLYVSSNAFHTLLQERPPLDLFKTIFAESSSESEMSYESDLETKQSDNKEAAATVARADIPPTQTALKSSGATKWQDLSLVSKGVLAPTSEVKGNRPASSRWDSRTAPDKEAKSNEERSFTNERHITVTEDKAETENPVSVADQFGPALPPGK